MEKINRFNSCFHEILFFCLCAYLVTEFILMAQTGQPSSTNTKNRSNSAGWMLFPWVSLAQKHHASLRNSLLMGHCVLAADRAVHHCKYIFSWSEISISLRLKTHSGIQSCIQSHNSRANTDSIAKIRVFWDNTLLEIQLSCYSYSSHKLQIYLGQIHYNCLQTCNEVSFEHCYSQGKHQSHLKVHLGTVQSQNELPGLVLHSMNRMDQVRHEMVCPYLDEA